MVDLGLLESDSEDHRLLADLLKHEYAEVYCYALDRDPKNQIWRQWSLIDPQTYNGSSVTYMRGSDRTTSVVRGDWPAVAARDLGTEIYAELGKEEATKQRFADGLACQIAWQALGVDLYVTDRDFLHEVDWAPSREVTICRPREALAFLGLYFRAQNVFPVAYNSFLNRGMFYWVGTCTLLPESWRWLSACLQHASQPHSELVLLASSLHERTRRAIEERDRIHLALNQPQDNDTLDAALSSLDVLLVMLMAAIDVTARVAHRVLGFSEPQRRAGWQKSGWLAQVSQEAPQLSAVVENTPGEHALTVVRLLRNSVHGAALQGTAVLDGRQRMKSLVALPSSDREAVHAAMEATGGGKLWGVEESVGSEILLDPGIFADRVLAEVMKLVNDLLRETPVERLSNVQLTERDCLPPQDGTFAPAVCRSVRWQLGL